MEVHQSTAKSTANLDRCRHSVKFILMTMAPILWTTVSVAQTVTCDELIEFIEKEGYHSGSVSNFEMNSSWLYKVTAYTYDYRLYIIAEVKRNEYSTQTTQYVFCGVPSMNWQNFRFKGYGDSDAYGKRFHKYILEYQCACD